MMNSKIAGIGRAVPPRVLSNFDLEKMVDTTDRWIVERTGIRQRRILGEDRSTSDLAAEAALDACQHAQINPEKIDAIIVCTVTPDTPMPATAVYVQQKIGAVDCPAFDLSAACAGFVYGVSVADSFIKSGRYQNVLLIGVEILSRVVDWTDRSTCVLFGDGAGAVVLMPTDEQGIIDVELRSDGAQACHLSIPGGGTAEPASRRTVEARRHFIQMNGRQVFTHAVKNMSAASKTVLERNGFCVDDVHWVIAHQANMRILEGVSHRVGIPMDRFIVNIEKYGNTSSASIPVAMKEAVQQDAIKKGDLVLLAALGSGLTWGAAIMRWSIDSKTI